MKKKMSPLEALCSKYDANFFFVTDGASCIVNHGNPAVKAARQAVAKWETKNGFNKDEDWSDDPSNFMNYRK